MHNRAQAEQETRTAETDEACRYLPMFPILAGIHGLLCHDQGRSSREREGAMSTETRGLLRVLTPQERGTLIKQQMQPRL